MRVQRVLMPGSGGESWTVVGDDHVPVEPVERFLAYLASIERSPNTVKAYAHDLKDWFTFLGRRGLDWQTVALEDVAGFVAWLRLPPAGRDGRVAVLPTVDHHCSAASVNRKLAALSSFCEFHARHGVQLAGLLTTLAPAGRCRSSSVTSYKPFLYHVTKHTASRRRAITLAAPTSRPKVLTAGETQSILDACDRLRDRLLFALLLDTGVRIGEALGLRHEDVAIDPEFGMFPLLWNRFEEMDGDRGLAERFDAIVRAGELDAQRARGWTLVRAVDNWLWSLESGTGSDAAAACAAIGTCSSGPAGSTAGDGRELVAGERAVGEHVDDLEPQRGGRAHHADGNLPG